MCGIQTTFFTGLFGPHIWIQLVEESLRFFWRNGVDAVDRLELAVADGLEERSKLDRIGKITVYDDDGLVQQAELRIIVRLTDDEDPVMVSFRWGAASLSSHSRHAVCRTVVQRRILETMRDAL